MGKFLIAWESYANQIKTVKKDKPQQIKEQFKNEDFDTLFKEKFSPEQSETLKDFKNLIYESERKKKEDSNK